MGSEMCIRDSGYTAPTPVLQSIRTHHPMFRGFQQHDAQEFLRCFMDLLHEELMEEAQSDHEEEEDENEGT